MCVHAAADGRRRRQHETMSPPSPPPPTSIVAPMQLMPSFLPSFLPRTFRVADLGFGGRMHCSGRRGERKEGRRKDKPPHGTFFSRASSSFPSTLLSLFFSSCLDRFRAGWNCDYEEREGFPPFIPLSRRSGVIAN